MNEAEKQLAVQIAERIWKIVTNGQPNSTPTVSEYPNYVQVQVTPPGPGRIPVMLGEHEESIRCVSIRIEPPTKASTTAWSVEITGGGIDWSVEPEGLGTLDDWNDSNCYHMTKKLYPLMGVKMDHGKLGVVYINPTEFLR